MRTTLQLPIELIEKASRLADAKTKTETIIIALKDYIRRKQMEKLMKSAGSLNIKSAWKKMRHGR